MRFLIAGTLVAVSLGGCAHGQSERTGMAKDTVITPRETRDTTIITTDTSVKVDTTVKRGQGAVPKDTTK